MEIFLVVFSVIYVIVFFASVFIVLKFEWSKEGNDERGKHILSSSYRLALPLLPIGWLALELIHDYVYAFSYEQYKWAIWFIVTAIYIILASSVTILKRRV